MTEGENTINNEDMDAETVKDQAEGMVDKPMDIRVDQDSMGDQMEGEMDGVMVISPPTGQMPAKENEKT